MRSSLTKKVTVSAVVCLLMVVAVASFTIYGMIASIDSANHVTNYSLKQLELSKQFDRALTSAIAKAQMLSFTLAEQDRREVLQSLELARLHLTAIEKLEFDDQLIQHASEEHPQLMQLLERRRSLLTLTERKVATLIDAIDAYDTPAVIDALDDLRRFERTFEQMANDADVIIDREVTASTQRMQELNRVRLIMAPSAFGVLVLMAIAALILLRRGIVRPINALSAAASAVARGDLSPVVHITSADEIGKLQQAFNQMVQSLRDQQQERERFEADLKHMALYDQLTTLPNRALFTDRLQHALIAAQRRNTQVAVMFLDLDNFKLINDSLGHHTGDQLLLAIAERLATSIRPGDTVARFGGDEFVILLEDITSADDAVAVVQRIQQHVHTPLLLDNHHVSPMISIGIAVGNSGDLLRDADTAMYRAKQNGKAQYALFDPSMKTHLVERLELESDLRRALDRDEFVLNYQPIINLESGLVVGLEVLVRWKHPQHGMISPAAFIPLAEETGLILPLGRWVLQTACRQAAHWLRTFPALAPLVISVNISARQFQDPQLTDIVVQALRESHLPATCLQLEITESIIMEKGEATLDVLETLKRLGVRLAIDDFGTGYSSLAYLKRFPIDTLKIDRTFTDGLGRDAEDTAITEAIVLLAQALNLNVTGEGVETEAQLQHLRALGCQHGQGFYFAKPLPPTAIENLLAAAHPTVHPRLLPASVGA